MTIALESMAVAMPEVVGHPNRTNFRGVLTVVDMPSQRPPSGSKGKLVMLTRRAAEAALPSLLGMALDYAPSFDRHDVRRKIGVITSAEVVGRNLEIGGYLYAKDFPEIVEEIGKSGRSEGIAASGRGSLAEANGIRAGGEYGIAGETTNWKASLATAIERILGVTVAQRIPREESREQRGGSSLQGAADSTKKSGLGMSYEITGVELADPHARVWTLTKVTFTGAAILRKDKAAYRDTWIALG
jgi:hypothetical protein